MSGNGNGLKMPGTRELPRSTPKTVRSKMDTLLITQEAVERWLRPPFQRELRMTPRVQALAGEIKANGGMIPGIITLGVLEAKTYLLDGQHRIAAFTMSGMVEGMADVRICTFETMGEMGEEFVTLNSALVRMRNDDILRGLEGNNEHLALLRRKCPFLGYAGIRMADANGKAKVVLSMAAAVRVWFGSDGPTPSHGPSSAESVKLLDEDQVGLLVSFLQACWEAWGGDKENFRLWSSLNLSILMWLWRRVVLAMHLPPAHRGGTRMARLTREQFVKCLMSLSANANYVDWLVGRSLSDRDRPPAYSRIRDTFVRRLADMGVKGVRFPQGEWVK